MEKRPSSSARAPGPPEVEVRQTLLLEAGRELLAPRRAAEVTQRLSALLCTHLVDTCTVELVCPDGGPLPLLTEALRRLPGAEEAEARLARVLRGGEAEGWDTAPGGAARAALLALRHEGTTRGLVLLTGRGLPPETLALTHEVLALAARGLELAAALEAAREAHARAESARARMEGLEALTVALSTAFTPEEVARVVVEETMRALGARSGGLFVLAPDGAALELMHSAGYDAPTRAAFGRLPPEAPVPVAEVTRTGAPVWLHDKAEYMARYPRSSAATSSLREEDDISVACLPLLARRPLGCLAISFARPHAFDADERAWLGVVARQCTMALERARLLAAERRHAARAEYLERFTATLAASLDVEETLRRTADLVLPELADFCFFDLHTPEGEVRRVARAHQSPERQRLLDATRWRPSRTGEQSICALESGAPMYEPFIDDAWLRRVARGPEHLALLRALGPCSRISVPLPGKERVLGSLTLYHAQSGRHYTQEDLTLAVELGRRAAVALENAQLFLQARQAIQLRDDFLAIAGHELNTPLTTLKLHLARLQKTSAEPDTRERVGVANNQVDRLTRLVRELLDVARISEGRLRLEPEGVDLVALSREVLGRLGDDMARLGTVVHLRERGPVEGRWDRSRLEQVVTNLVGNALKYGRGQPVELEVSLGEGLAYLKVRDQGIGIAPEQQVRLFQRFQRGVSVRHYGGFGLGLWIARQVVEAHGGRISLESALDVGTTFTVELPLSPPQ